jgi:NAD(P)-dependent dehydrogenase (short-subunit alcohol dehydrogenase family)
MSDCVALLTGADGGLGHTVAARLAKDGRLVLGHHPGSGIDVPVGGDVLPVAADVTFETDVRDFIASAVGGFGRIDVLVTLAGVMEQRFLPELDLATWNHTLAVNLTGTCLCVSAAAEELRKTGIRGDHRPPARLHRKHQLRRLHRVEGRCRRADPSAGARGAGKSRCPRSDRDTADRCTCHCRMGRTENLLTDHGWSFRAAQGSGDPGGVTGQRRSQLHHRSNHQRQWGRAIP